VPDDIYSELYRELAEILVNSSDAEGQRLILGDVIQLRQAVDCALVLAGTQVDLTRIEEGFSESAVTAIEDPLQRRAAVERLLTTFIGDQSEAVRSLRQALDELAADPVRQAEAKGRALDAIVNDPVRSRKAFEAVRPDHLRGERAVATFLEAAFEILDDLGGDALANRYFNLLGDFIDRFSLRYDLRRPCTLCPTLTGIFANLLRDLRAVTQQDAHLDMLMKDFESAVRDLRQGCSDGRIKTCIQKQVNLLEAIGRAFPGVTGTTLGAICDQVGTWPHEKLKAAMKALYGFASDYPGIRHGGTPQSALRAVDMRDMVAMSILLAGFTPYLSNSLDADVVYRGS
jgi:hypothetical protein